MKKKAAIVIIALIAILSIFFVIMNEKNMKTPVERFLETSQTTSKAENYVPVKILMDNKNIQYEFLSYDLIDDKDIVKQTKYKAEYFIDGKVPPSDYVVKWVDFDAMRRDYPKVDEHISSNGKAGMTRAEYEMFLQDHEAEYTTDKHVKTKYLFIRCRITYTGNGRNKERLDNVSVLTMNGNKTINQMNEFCYLDHPQPEIWEDNDREGGYFWHGFEKAGDCIECVIGCRLREYNDVLTLKDNDVYYIGFEPQGYCDDEEVNPKVDDKFVSTDSLPCESYLRSSDRENKV